VYLTINYSSFDKLFSDIELDDMPIECYGNDEFYKDMVNIDFYWYNVVLWFLDIFWNFVSCV
jgi:hypothetical protein